MRHLLYCYRSRLNSYWCLKKKFQKHLPTQNLPAVCQKQIFQNKKNAKKKMFSRPTDPSFSGYVIGNKDLFLGLRVYIVNQHPPG